MEELRREEEEYKRNILLYNVHIMHLVMQYPQNIYVYFIYSKKLLIENLFLYQLNTKKNVS